MQWKGSSYAGRRSIQTRTRLRRNTNVNTSISQASVVNHAAGLCEKTHIWLCCRLMYGVRCRRGARRFEATTLYDRPDRRHKLHTTTLLTSDVGGHRNAQTMQASKHRCHVSNDSRHVTSGLKAVRRQTESLLHSFILDQLLHRLYRTLKQ